MSTDPRTEALASIEQAVDRLAEAARLVSELWSIGIWQESDDSSDNRQRRQLLREIDWAVSGALRAMESLQESEALASLRTDLSALVAIVEPLPSRVSDIMEESALDAEILDVRERLEGIQQQAGELASHLRASAQAAHDEQ